MVMMRWLMVCLLAMSLLAVANLTEERAPDCDVECCDVCRALYEGQPTARQELAAMRKRLADR